MAAPLASHKKTVDLAGGPAKVSRIRRDPPPVVKEKTVTRAEVREREAWMLAIGILSITAALFVILIAVSNWAGWSLSDYMIVWRERV
jgi:1,4-dihydroxy-2-naphthoate octaprenyltransferase